MSEEEYIEIRDVRALDQAEEVPEENPEEALKTLKAMADKLKRNGVKNLSETESEVIKLILDQKIDAIKAAARKMKAVPGAKLIRRLRGVIATLEAIRKE